MDVNTQKQLLQQEAVSFFQKHDNILLNWATGSSKSLAAIKCIADFSYVMNGDNKQENEYPKVLIVVAEMLHKDNWIQEFRKWNYEYLLDNIVIECYASIKKYKDTYWNIIIFDECHHISDLRKDLIESIEYGKAILLSATLDSTTRERIEEVITFATHTVTLDDAIERGLIAPPEIHLISVSMNSTVKNVPVKYGKKEVLVTQVEAYKKFEKSFNFWKETKEKLLEEGKDIGWIANKTKILGSQRKKFFAECKTSAAKYLIKNLEKEGTRFICFTGSIEQSNDICHERAINSTNSKKKNGEILKAFNDKEISYILMIKMGREGLNLTGIEAGICIQLDSGADEGRSFLQMLGRALRGVNPRMYIFYLKGTEDERYLRKALENIDSKYIIKEK